MCPTESLTIHTDTYIYLSRRTQILSSTNSSQSHTSTPPCRSSCGFWPLSPVRHRPCCRVCSPPCQAPPSIPTSRLLCSSGPEENSQGPRRHIEHSTIQHIIITGVYSQRQKVSMYASVGFEGSSIIAGGIASRLEPELSEGLVHPTSNVSSWAKSYLHLFNLSLKLSKTSAEMFFPLYPYIIHIHPCGKHTCKPTVRTGRHI